MNEESRESQPTAGLSKGLGLLVRQGLKRLATGALAAAFGGPIAWLGGGCLVAVVVLFLLPLFIIILIMIGAGGELSFKVPTAEAAPSAGDGTGLIDNTWCQSIYTLPDGSCSRKLEVLFEEAADWSKVPAGILVGVAAKECPYVFYLTDTEVDQYSQAGAQVPHDKNGDDTAGDPNPWDDGCPDSIVGGAPFAHGPMQFSLPTWDIYKDAYKKANSATTRATDVHNLADSIYAAAWYLKCLQIQHTNPTPEYTTACSNGDFKEVPFDVSTSPPGDTNQRWEEDDLFPVLTAYAGFSDQSACIDQSYCNSILTIYEATADFGSTDAPWGWPTSGTITPGQGPWEGTHNGDESVGSSIDIGNDAGTNIYATHDGRAYRRESKDKGGNYVGCGMWVEINGGGYVTQYCHLKSYSACVGDGQEVKASELIGLMDSTGRSTGNHLHYSIKYDDGRSLTKDEFNSRVPEYEGGDWVETKYTGVNCQ